MEMEIAYARFFDSKREKNFNIRNYFLDFWKYYLCGFNFKTKLRNSDKRALRKHKKSLPSSSECQKVFLTKQVS